MLKKVGVDGKRSFRYTEGYYTCKRLQRRMTIHVGTSPKDLKYKCKLSIASPCGALADFAKSEEESCKSAKETISTTT